MCAAPHASPRARWTPVLYVLRVPSAKLRPVWSLATHLRVERIECKPPRALRKSRRFSYGSPSRRAGVLFFPSLLLLCTGSLYSEHTHFRIRRLLTRTGFFFNREPLQSWCCQVFFLPKKEARVRTFQECSWVLVLARDTDNLAGSGRPVQLRHQRMGYTTQRRPEERTRTGVKPPAKFRRPAGGHGLGATTSTDDDGAGSSSN